MTKTPRQRHVPWTCRSPTQDSVHVLITHPGQYAHADHPPWTVCMLITHPGLCACRLSDIEAPEAGRRSSPPVGGCCLPAHRQQRRNGPAPPVVSHMPHGPKGAPWLSSEWGAAGMSFTHWVGSSDHPPEVPEVTGICEWHRPHG